VEQLEAHQQPHQQLLLVEQLEAHHQPHQQLLLVEQLEAQQELLLDQQLEEQLYLQMLHLLYQPLPVHFRLLLEVLAIKALLVRLALQTLSPLEVSSQPWERSQALRNVHLVPRIVHLELARLFAHAMLGLDQTEL